VFDVTHQEAAAKPELATTDTLAYHQNVASFVIAVQASPGSAVYNAIYLFAFALQVGSTHLINESNVSFSVILLFDIF
jgi:hypothetical protein